MVNQVKTSMLGHNYSRPVSRNGKEVLVNIGKER